MKIETKYFADKKLFKTSKHKESISIWRPSQSTDLSRQ